jgi:hypothetical protein
MKGIGIGYEAAFGIWMVVVGGGVGAVVHDFCAYGHESRSVLQ